MFENEPMLRAEVVKLAAQIREQNATIGRLECFLRTKVAKFLCPVHGSASCPEEYMLDPEGKPWDSNRWSEDMRCGQRFSLAALGEGE